MKDKILEAVQISKTYGEGESAVQALKASDLTIWKGEFASIIGSSGSSPPRIFRRVDFPLPLEPMMDANSPFQIVRSLAFNA